MIKQIILIGLMAGAISLVIGTIFNGGITFPKFPLKTLLEREIDKRRTN